MALWVRNGSILRTFDLSPSLCNSCSAQDVSDEGVQEVGGQTGCYGVFA